MKRRPWIIERLAGDEWIRWPGSYGTRQPAQEVINRYCWGWDKGRLGFRVRHRDESA